MSASAAYYVSILPSGPHHMKSSTETINSHAVYESDLLQSPADYFSEFIIPLARSDSDSLPDLDDMPLNACAPDSVDAMYQYLFGTANNVLPTIASNNVALHSTYTDEQSALIRSDDNSLTGTRSLCHKASEPSFTLSSRVAVTDSNSESIQIVFPIENTYRPRYKSDYFPQNGLTRHPRYVADSEDNHYITLKLPTAYYHALADKYIRVALITVFIEGHGHYFSPYKFQQDHNDLKIPDENPIYVKVETDAEDNFTMKLQLVLIKSKLSQLSYAQPLMLFSAATTDTQNATPERILSPKNLISQYQLDKSHIAFTLCTKLLDGTYRPHADTTTVSSVITEASAAKKPNATPARTAQPTVDPKQHLCCPKCTYQFAHNAASSSNESHERQSAHTTWCNSTETTAIVTGKKRKKMD